MHFWLQDDETDIFTDLCNFNTYDIDENGEISLDELLAISGRSDESQRLFLSLDNEKGYSFHSLAPICS
jgi:Ca2+-binding EF-hand superfamily protein